MLFRVNQQKYFASTMAPTLTKTSTACGPVTATAVDRASGKFRSRAGLSTPVGMGFEYLDGRPESKLKAAGGVLTLYGKSYDLIEDAAACGRDAKETHGQAGRARQVRLGAQPRAHVPHHP